MKSRSFWNERGFDGVPVNNECGTE